jgi:hypothetical protein
MIGAQFPALVNERFFKDRDGFVYATGPFVGKAKGIKRTTCLVLARTEGFSLRLQRLLMKRNRLVIPTDD